MFDTKKQQHQHSKRRLLLGAAISCAFPLLSRANAAPAALVGAGATLPASMYDRWGQRFTASTGLDFRYAALGSDQSLPLMTQGRVNFGATEIPYSRPTLAHYQLIQFPVAEAAVVLVANLRGLASNNLRLTPALVSQIYRGQIRHWRDPAILQINDSLDIPDLSITPVSRSGRSGTTLALSRFLTFTDAAWRADIGLSAQANWDYGLLAKSASDVEAVVSRTPGSIGYVAAGQRLSSALSLLAVGYPELGFFTAPTSTDELRNWPLTILTYALLRQKPSNSFDQAAFEFLRDAITDWQDLTQQAGLAPLTTLKQQSVLALWQEQGLMKPS